MTATVEKRTCDNCLKSEEWEPKTFGRGGFQEWIRTNRNDGFCNKTLDFCSIECLTQYYNNAREFNK